jgi:hypothetical protein
LETFVSIAVRNKAYLPSRDLLLSCGGESWTGLPSCLLLDSDKSCGVVVSL